MVVIDSADVISLTTEHGLLQMACCVLDEVDFKTELEDERHCNRYAVLRGGDEVSSKYQTAGQVRISSFPAPSNRSEQNIDDSISAPKAPLEIATKYKTEI